MLSNRRVVIFACAVVSLYLLWNVPDPEFLFNDIFPRSTSDQQTLVQQTPLPCRGLLGAEDTLIIFRTGSTELEDRLAIHLSTSLRCFPNYLIFSDHEEHYNGEHILDALADVTPEILATNPDFELHRRLQEGGRASLDPSELAGSPDGFAKMTGKTENPGWKLDKWKFLPMVNSTYYERPNMKWYVFIEADTFVLWSMLQQYLATLDSSKPIYTGSQTYIGGDLFAHGGSGFAVSEPAMRKVVDHYTTYKSEIEQFTDGHWAGDCVLGKAFTDSSVPFTNGWPAFQGDYPGLIPYAQPDGRSVADESLREWCHPTISYHHMSPAMIYDLWHFEQEWIASHDLTNETLRHKDIFTDHVMPQMTSPRDGWDNLSDKEDGHFATVEECRAKCLQQPDCKQYSFDQDRMCRTRVDPRLGKAGQGVSSGWIMDRVNDFQQSMEPCGSEGWPV